MSLSESVLVYELISAGGYAAGVPPDLHEQGCAMRDAMLADLAAGGHYQVRVASTAASAPGALAGSPSPLQASPGETAEHFLERVSPAFERVWVVAPESGGVLARLQQAVGEPRWVGCSADAIRLTASKGATRARLATLGIPVPASEPWQAAADSAWVIKPDDGAGTQDTHRFATHVDACAELEARLAAGRASTIECWVAGEPLSLSLLVGRSGVELLSINRQRIALDGDGAVRYLGVDCAIEAPGSQRGQCLQALAERLCAGIAGLRGFVGVDLMWTPDSGPVVLEINPRLTCAYVGLSARLGRNLAREILDASAQPAVRTEEAEHVV